MKTMKDYHDLYLRCDVSLLADVSEKIRNGSLKKFGLCQSHYLSVATLSCDAMLNITKSQLELILDAHMCLFFENRYDRSSFRYFHVM